MTAPLAARDLETRTPVILLDASPHSKVKTVAVENAMHPDVYRVALGCWLAFLAIFWITFSIGANALFMIVIDCVYAAMFFGVTYIGMRMARDEKPADTPFAAFLRKPFATLTGPIEGHEALVQVILVPASLILGGLAIGVIIHLSR